MIPTKTTAGSGEIKGLAEAIAGNGNGEGGGAAAKKPVVVVSQQPASASMTPSDARSVQAGATLVAMVKETVESFAER